MTNNLYIEKYAMLLRAKLRPSELRRIINAIYVDGFEDGANSERENKE